MSRTLLLRGLAARTRLVGPRMYSSHNKQEYYVDPDPQIGDYPNLPQKFAEDRSPYGKYWDRQMRRNFGEPIHEQDEILNMWAPTRYSSPGWKQVGKMWACTIALVGTVYYIIAKTRSETPYLRAYYPNGLKDELGGLPTRTLADSIEEASK